MRRLLIADDDVEIRESLAALIARTGWEVTQAGDGLEALRAIEESPPHLLLLDLKMPEKGGEQVLEEVRFLEPDLPVVILTGHGDIEGAVRAMKLGAHDFLTKPPDPDHLLLVLERAVERKALEREVSRTRRTLAETFAIVGGEAPAMQTFLDQLEKVAATEATVLLMGETGTGKELAARAIWADGPRSGAPFVVVNCATLSETLLESDLFGHEKGAFTGAVAGKKGMVEEADGGTLFLDEVGELPAPVQAKLLRVIEYGEFQRVGSTVARHSDVRVIAATNRDLEAEIEAGSFRSDLFHRLSVVTLTVPPLRERLEDLPAIVNHHLKLLGAELGRPIQDLEPEVWERLSAYDWPGNVREVRNVLERGLVLSPDGQIHAEDIPRPGEAKAGGRAEIEVPPGTTLAEAMETYKRWMIRRTLEACEGNQTKAADMLDIHRSSLNRMLKELDLR